QIAIDGPSAAGKSSVARHVAHALDLRYIDSGALFRCITLKAMHFRRDPDDWQSFVRGTRLVIGPLVVLNQTNGGRTLSEPTIAMDGADVTTAIRDRAVTAASLRIAAIPEVRAALLDVKRELAAADPRGVVMDGRDIGTHVFPHAHAKLFLTADVRVRAERRWRELAARAAATNTVVPPLDDVVDELRARDLADIQRAISPLVQAPDAVLLDSTGLDRDRVVQRAVAIVK
ncbi:Cytidylate kinase-domain-containing protein, partial [Blastocladiella britannica]